MINLHLPHIRSSTGSSTAPSIASATAQTRPPAYAMEQPPTANVDPAPAEPPLDKHPTRLGTAENADHYFMACGADYSALPKFINLREITLIVTEG